MLYMCLVMDVRCNNIHSNMVFVNKHKISCHIPKHTNPHKFRDISTDKMFKCLVKSII
jgi:hypothetical protein